MKTFRGIASLCTIIIAACSLSGQAPAGYYSSLSGLKSADLKTATYKLIHNLTRVSSYSALPDYFRYTDVYPNSRMWWDMYSDIPRNSSSFSGMNREHSFPKSWWGGSTEVQAYTDLNHLYPSDAKANSAKSNYPLGEVDRSKGVYLNNGVTVVGIPVVGQGGGAKYVFEPDDEYKGDFARTYFYMVTCYQDYSWAHKYMLEQNLYPTLNNWSVSLLMKWHRQDPVSQKEIDRNNQVFRIQNNRNPFIDLPELAEYIWGTKTGEAFTPGEVVVPPTGDPELIAPVPNMELEFGEVALGQKIVRQLLVAGKFLKGSIEATLYSGDKGMFSLTNKQIPGTLVCTEDGYWLDITYSPTAIGTHTTKIALSGDFGSRTVNLRGQCLAQPTLTACTALPADEITSDSYRANWDAPAAEVIDYFVITRQRYVGGQVYTTEELADASGETIEGFDTSDREAYSVQSVRLGVRSPQSNVVFVDHAGVSTVAVGEPLVVQAFDGCIRFLCSAPQQGCRIYSASGAMVSYIDSIEANDEVSLAPGVYLIVTNQHPNPIKAIVY